MMSNYERNLMRIRGFRDGAGGNSVNAEYAPNSDYAKGYVDGYQAKYQYARQSAIELGVDLNEILPMKMNCDALAEKVRTNDRKA